MKFHIARVMDRFETYDSDDEYDDDAYTYSGDEDDDDSLSSESSGDSSCSDDSDDSGTSFNTSHTDDDTVNNKADNRHNPDQVHYRAQECLYRDDTKQAILVYQQLLAKQRKNVHAQRADTLSRLAVLCLVSGGKKYHKRALRYSTEALKLHQDSARPLQAAVSTMELGLVYFGLRKRSKALKLWRQAMQMACLAMGYDHPHVGKPS